MGQQRPTTKQSPELVASVSWNYGASRRRPAISTNDMRYDPSWYKKPPPRRGLMAWLRGLLR